VDRRQIDSAGDFAHRPCVSPIRLRSACSYAKALDQCGWHDSDFVSSQPSFVRNRERLGAGFEHDAALGPTLQDRPDDFVRYQALVDDCTVGDPNANLGSPSTQIDRHVLHD
jgi:hypothetical protein